MIFKNRDELDKEKDFLNDAINFYKDKNYQPSLKTIESNYTVYRENPNFTEEDFLKNSQIVFQVVNQIYLIGLAEYKSELSFEQFLYYVFWNPGIWQKSNERYSFPRVGRWSRRRFNKSEFRKKLKFIQKGIAKKSTEDSVKESWREYKQISRDKKKSYTRYRSRWERYDRKTFRDKKNEEE